jgi:phosphoenolpyruvate synthase/pyruvate phosphate dikinase
VTNVVFFDQPDSAAGSLVGGKGANLILLTSAGFPVPPGFVVTSDAYQQFIESAPWLESALGRLDYHRPDVLREQCAQIRRRLIDAELPPDVQQSIHAALQKIEPEKLEESAFAVRSSSTFEDLAQAAFAGQHDTYLNVRGPAKILDRVRACFASLWEDRAVLYRRHQGFSQTEARMAVVVQRQIDCEVAGVGFSIDPIGGRMDRLIINANYGIGESVVSGEGEIDQFEILKPTLQIAERAIGHKEHHVLAMQAGDVESRPVPAHLVDHPCLTDEQITAIAGLLKRVEDHYGWPQDIEWGIKSGHLYLLQSRPVTTLQPDWTRDESAERFPNPMTPLSWDFISVAFRASLSHSLSLMGLPALKGDWFQIFDHYIFGNQNAVRLVAMFRPLKARNAAELIAEIPALRRRFAWVMDLPVNWARDLDRYLIRLGHLQSRPDPATLADAWKLISDVLETAADYFRPNIAISMTQSGLHRLLHGLIIMVVGPAQAMPILDGLLTGCQTKTAIVNREIHDMAALAAQTPSLRAELLDRGGRPFFDSGRLTAYPAFAARFQRFLEDHGHREVDMDYCQPTWSGHPWIVLDSVVLLLRAPTLENPTESMRAQRIRYAQTEQQFMASVPDELRFFFRELIALTRTYTMLDDLEHYQTTRINPLAYRAALAMGRLLRDLGVFEDPADIFFLNKGDVEALAANPTPDLIETCRKKATTAKASYRHAFAQAPESTSQPAGSAPSATSGNVLRGLPGSPGRATGKAFRVRGPEDFARFPNRAVLIARTTNPAWTPLFYAASAIITESGGPLSHGAVTAREMGLPAVMSVRGIMNLITDGQTLSVDGTTGIVEIKGV